MSQSVKVKVRPGGTVQFPGICVHCSRPAGERLLLKKRRGRLTRLIDVPLCDQCAAELGRQSGEEERMGRLGRFVAILVALLVLILGFVVLPSGLPVVIRVMIAAAVAVIAGRLIFAFFKRKSLAAAHPEKTTILDSARMTQFSWRATTFRFNNEDFAGQFMQLNESRLMPHSNGNAE
ncbi:MAG: hypothetical protein JSW55_12020 [Chloroflexota bacterium]|nr:MAG: hypothetical protein JSW55_12020 [Chloroflexota bacterium]